MPGNRRWTPAEDALIRRAAYESAYYGLRRERDHLSRLQVVAKECGRSYAAVRRRASRLRINTYQFMSRAQFGLRYQTEHWHDED